MAYCWEDARFAAAELIIPPPTITDLAVRAADQVGYVSVTFQTTRSDYYYLLQRADSTGAFQTVAVLTNTGLVKAPSRQQFTYAIIGVGVGGGPRSNSAIATAR